MIQIGSCLNIIDNSGAKTAKCIHVITKHKAKYASIGDIILVSVKKVRKKRRDPTKISKGKIFKALILRVKLPIKNIAYGRVRFLENSGILLNRQTNKLIGTRILGPITSSFRYNKFSRLLILSSGII